jgi:hypothetical protein
LHRLLKEITTEENTEGDISPSADLFGEEHPSKAPPSAANDHFETWWVCYPRKIAKTAARRAYERILQHGTASAEDLLEGARRYAAEREGEDPKFTKHPANWLNGGCWADEPTPSRGKGPPTIDEHGNVVAPAPRPDRPRNAGMSHVDRALRGMRR